MSNCKCGPKCTCGSECDCHAKHEKAVITARLDRIASELERIDPRLALAVDQVSDRLERVAVDQKMSPQQAIKVLEDAKKNPQFAQALVQVSQHLKQIRSASNVNAASLGGLAGTVLLALMALAPSAFAQSDFDAFEKESNMAFAEMDKQVSDFSSTHELNVKKLQDADKATQSNAMKEIKGMADDIGRLFESSAGENQKDTAFVDSYTNGVTKKYTANNKKQVNILKGIRDLKLKIFHLKKQRALDVFDEASENLVDALYDKYEKSFPDMMRA